MNILHALSKVENDKKFKLNIIFYCPESHMRFSEENRFGLCGLCGLLRDYFVSVCEERRATAKPAACELVLD